MTLGDLNSNFKAPDLIREKFSGGPDIEGTYKIYRKIKDKFKMQQHLQKAISTPVDISLQTVKDKKQKIQNDSPEIQHCWRDHSHLCCIRVDDTSVVLNF